MTATLDAAAVPASPLSTFPVTDAATGDTLAKITDVRPDPKILQQEIFGPVAPVVVWDDEPTLHRWLADRPFGGTKQSGLGREGAREGIHEFQETFYYSVDLPQR